MSKRFYGIKVLLFCLLAFICLGFGKEEVKADWVTKFVDGVWDDYYCDENENILYDFVGVVKSPYNDNLVYVKDGKINYNYTGLAYYENKIVVVYFGTLIEYSGFVLNDDLENPMFADSYSGDSISYWYVKDGCVQENYTGCELLGIYEFLKPDTIKDDFDLASINPSRIFYINNGVWDRNYSGIVKDKNTTDSVRHYLIKNGMKDMYTGFHDALPGAYFFEGCSDSYLNGFLQIDGKEYYFVDGMLYNHTGLVKPNDGAENTYYYLENGCLNPDLPDMLVNYENNLWYVSGGVAQTYYSGIYELDGIKWYLKDGKVDKNYVGLAEYNSNHWYIKNGQIDYNYVGMVKSGDAWYDVKDGEGYWAYFGDNGFYNINGEDYYYVKGKPSDNTGLIYDTSSQNWKYLVKGRWDDSVNTLSKYNGSWWYVSAGIVDFNYTGLYKYNGTWWYIKNGKIDWNYKGLVKYNGSWWYIENGQINWKYQGLTKYSGSWWYVKNGKLDFGYTGLAKHSGSWFHVKNGMVKFGYTGLSKYIKDWWYMKNGTIQFSYTGLVSHSGTWYYVSGGKLNWNATGLCKYAGNWWYVRGGILRFDYTGLAKNSAGWFHVNNGKVKFGYTGMTSNENGWWYMRNGKLDFSYTGLGTNASGTWYYKNGKLQFGYTGRTYVGNVPYRVEKGQAKRIYIPTNYLTKANTTYRTMEEAYRSGDYSRIPEYEKQFAKGLFNCMDEALCYTTDWEREKAVYDYLCRHVRYDYDTYYAYLGYEGYEMDWNVFNEVGALRDGLAVCDGYAHAFMYVMNMLGIPCERVSGTSKFSGEGHAWNRVQIGGKWYQLDVTWADQVSWIDYDYFNITDAKMSEDHAYVIRDYNPKCISTEHSYDAYVKKYGKNK